MYICVPIWRVDNSFLWIQVNTFYGLNTSFFNTRTSKFRVSVEELEDRYAIKKVAVCIRNYKLSVWQLPRVSRGSSQEPNSQGHQIHKRLSIRHWVSTNSSTSTLEMNRRPIDSSFEFRLCDLRNSIRNSGVLKILWNWIICTCINEKLREM